jgi:hypothetical protein
MPLCSHHVPFEKRCAACVTEGLAREAARNQPLVDMNIDGEAYRSNIRGNERQLALVTFPPSPQNYCRNERRRSAETVRLKVSS